MLTENHVKALIARLAIVYDEKVLEKNTALKPADDEWDAPYITIDDGEYILLENDPHQDHRRTFDLYYRQTYPGSMDEPPSEDYLPVKTEIALISMNHVARAILHRAIAEHIDQVDMEEVYNSAIEDTPF